MNDVVIEIVDKSDFSDVETRFDKIALSMLDMCWWFSMLTFLDVLALFSFGLTSSFDISLWPREALVVFFVLAATTIFSGFVFVVMFFFNIMLFLINDRKLINEGTKKGEIKR